MPMNTPETYESEVSRIESMSCLTPVVNIERVQSIEAACRVRLECEPENYNARLGLAWCLFVQALHQSGRESILLEAMASDNGRTKAEEAPADGHSAKLLRECLNQTVAVRHLSPDPKDQAGVEQIKALVRLSGCEEEIRQSDRHAEKILNDLVYAIVNV